MLNQEREKNIFKERVLIAFFFLIIALSCLIVNLAHLQILEFNNYKKKSEKNYIKIIPTEAKRGAITDRNGVVLASTRFIADITLIPEKVYYEHTSHYIF